MDRDNVAKEIAGYVHRGLRVVRLHGVRSPGICTCRKAADCPSPGKHPAGDTWQTTTDEQDVFEWWAQGLHNVGVMLGNQYRGAGPAVIDIESDSDEATAELRRLGLDRYETPTWSSGRGLHRLFLWSPELPDIAVLKPNGVEVRMGGGGKMAHSVIPPSTHHTGRLYAWLPGFSLADVEIAPIPDNVIEAILAEGRRRTARGSVSGIADRRPAAILRRPAVEGGRNDSLFRGACFLARLLNPGDEEQEQTLLELLRALNAIRCRPPLNDDEVVSVFRSAMKYRREDLATESLFPGVEAVIEGTRTLFRPAGLELTIHQGDPTTFELRCDALRESNGTGVMRVTADVWTDPRRMRDAMIDAFPGVPFDRFPGDFARIWSGVAPKPGTRSAPATEAVTGLRLLLENEAVAAGRRIEVTDPAEHSTRRLVGLMVTRLDAISEGTAVPCLNRDDVDPPSDNEVLAELIAYRHGGWLGNRLWFSWERLWRDIGTTYFTERDAPTKVARAIPGIIGRKLAPQRFQRHGRRATARSLTAHELELLRTFAAGDAAAANVCTYGACAGAPDGENGVAGVAATEENAI